MDAKSIYKEVKNAIHNDLGLTKEDIYDVVIETVKDEIDKLMNDEGFIRGLVEKEVARSLYKKDNNRWHTIYDAANYVEDKITSTILQTVKDKLVISLKEDEYEGNYDPNEWEPVKDEESGHYVVKHKVGEKSE
nr:MAG TPA: hypothetical protein [Caudoviricetes sp.]